MNTQRVRRMLWPLFAALVLGTSYSAHAGLFRTYLSVNGNDANLCTIAAPCRLLPAALAAVNDGGEVWMLDSANFNTGTVAITKSVTILAVPGAVGSIVANAASAISINAAGVKVTLRNLNVLNLIGSTNYGIDMMQGAELTVENCEVYGMSIGIVARAAGSVVAIKSTVVRDTTATGVYALNAVKATLDGVHVLNATTGLSVLSGASAAVRNSVFAGNSTAGIWVFADGGTIGQLLLVNSALNVNGYGVFAQTGTATDAVSITLQRNTLSGNATAVASAATASSTFTVVLDNNALIGNATAINYGSPAVVHSRGNNTLKLNGLDVSGPALTPLAGQ